MKSNLFSSFDPRDPANDKFASDLKRLLQTDQTQRDLLLQAFPELYREESAIRREPHLSDLAEKTGLDRLTIRSATAFLAFMVDQLYDERINAAADSPESWTEDLVSLGVIESDLAPTFTGFMRAVKRLTEQELLSIKRERLAGAGVLPALIGIGTTVELRGIFEGGHTFRTPVAEYTPRLKGITSIVSVAISLDMGSPSQFGFQATPNDLDLLIGALESAKKEVTTLRESCGM